MAGKAMPLAARMGEQGGWLFRWRSYLPLPLLIVLAVWVHLHAPPGQDTPRHLEWEVFCLAVGLAGFALRVWVAGLVPAGSSGRNTRQQSATRLNVSGPYSLVRHPLYVGNFLMWIAVALFTRSVPWMLLSGTYFWFTYERIMLAEERFLFERFGDAFLEWAAVTPAVLPAWSRWKAADTAYSWRAAARREYSGLLGLIGALALLEMAEETALPGSLHLDPLWAVLLLGAVSVYLVLRTLKRHTHWLSVSGR